MTENKVTIEIKGGAKTLGNIGNTATALSNADAVNIKNSLVSLASGISTLKVSLNDFDHNTLLKNLNKRFAGTTKVFERFAQVDANHIKDVFSEFSNGINSITTIDSNTFSKLTQVKSTFKRIGETFEKINKADIADAVEKITKSSEAAIAAEERAYQKRQEMYAKTREEKLKEKTWWFDQLLHGHVYKAMFGEGGNTPKEYVKAFSDAFKSEFIPQIFKRKKNNLSDEDKKDLSESFKNSMSKYGDVIKPKGFLGRLFSKKMPQTSDTMDISEQLKHTKKPLFGEITEDEKQLIDAFNNMSAQFSNTLPTTNKKQKTVKYENSLIKHIINIEKKLATSIKKNPVVDKFGKFFKKFSDNLKKTAGDQKHKGVFSGFKSTLAGAFKGMLIGSILNLIMSVISKIINFIKTMILGPFKIAMNFAKKVIGFLKQAMNSAETFKNLIDMSFKPFTILFTLMFAPAIMKLAPVMKDMILEVVKHKDDIKTIGTKIGKLIYNIINGGKGFRYTLELAFQIVDDFLNRAISQTTAYDSPITKLGKVISLAIDYISEFFSSKIGQDIISKVIIASDKIFHSFVTGITRVIGSNLGTIVDSVIISMSIIVDMVTTLINSISTHIPDIIHQIVTGISEYNRIKGDIETAMKDVREKLNEWYGDYETAKNKVKYFYENNKDLPDRIVNKIGDIGDTFSNNTISKIEEIKNDTILAIVTAIGKAPFILATSIVKAIADLLYDLSGNKIFKKLSMGAEDTLMQLTMDPERKKKYYDPERDALVNELFGDELLQNRLKELSHNIKETDDMFKVFNRTTDISRLSTEKYNEIMAGYDDKMKESLVSLNELSKQYDKFTPEQKTMFDTSLSILKEYSNNSTKEFKTIFDNYMLAVINTKNGVTLTFQEIDNQAETSYNNVSKTATNVTNSITTACNNINNAVTTIGNIKSHEWSFAESANYSVPKSLSGANTMLGNYGKTNNNNNTTNYNDNTRNLNLNLTSNNMSVSDIIGSINAFS